METHLNLAHRSSRKAELHTAAHRFAEAISHYGKALDHLEKAIIGTECEIVRASLVLQRQYTCDQIELLKRRRRYRSISTPLSSSCSSMTTIIGNNHNNNRQRFLGRDLNRNFFAIVTGQRDASHSAAIMSANTSAATTATNTAIDCDDLRTLFREQKSLLDCLMIVDQKKSFEIDVNDSSRSNSGSARSSPSMNESRTIAAPISGSRKPKKAHREIVEELTMLNEKLRQYVDFLVDSVDKSRTEAEDLRAENGQLRRELTALRSAENIKQAINKPIPELPPLEPPKLLY